MLARHKQAERRLLGRQAQCNKRRLQLRRIRGLVRYKERIATPAMSSLCWNRLLKYDQLQIRSRNRGGGSDSTHSV
jgi:hypothetical protein